MGDNIEYNELLKKYYFILGIIDIREKLICI